MKIDPSLVEKLTTAARDCSRHAYCPYSEFPVGAAALGTSGRIYGGCNVENASFGLTNCAERTAIFSAVAGGETCVELIAVFTPTDHPTPPCGPCRQVIYEFNPNCVVICVAKTGETHQFAITDLLPMAFGANDITREDLMQIPDSNITSLEYRIESQSTDAETSFDLSSLASDLRKAGVNGSIEEEKTPSEGKDGGLTTAIAISGLILASVDTLLGVLNFWLSSRPKYTAKLSLDGVEFTIESHDLADLKAKLASVQTGKKRGKKVVIQLLK